MKIGDFIIYNKIVCQITQLIDNDLYVMCFDNQNNPNNFLINDNNVIIANNDDIISFNPLVKESIDKIINLELEKLKKRLELKKYKISFDTSITNRISELNTQEEFGARPVKRIIQNLCEDFLSEMILRGEILENQNILLKFKDGEIKITKKRV
jgi:ATP-dependent Clp protease ATP-binding subunit ClpA